MLTDRELAAMLAVKPATLRVWRWRKKGPPWVKVERSVRYRLEDVERWIEERRRGE